MAHLEVDRERCARDGLCSLECPITLIERDGEGFPVAAPHMETACILCGHCVAVCPEGCLRIGGEGGFSQEDLAPSPKAPNVSGQALLDWMTTRRSVRNFADRPVPREEIAKCLEAARYAPSALNGQPACWIVLERAADIRVLAGLCADYLRDTGFSPNFLKPFDAGRETILRDAPCLVVAHAAAAAAIPPATDCVIALSHFELAAHALGLGVCWAGVLRFVVGNYAPAREFLGLPPGHEMYGGLMLGYPRFRLRHLPPRKPVRVSWR